MCTKTYAATPVVYGGTSSDHLITYTYDLAGHAVRIRWRPPCARCDDVLKIVDRWSWLDICDAYIWAQDGGAVRRHGGSPTALVTRGETGDCR
jgi:hypothetical protein